MKVGARPKTPSDYKVFIERDRLTSRNLTFEAFTYPVEFKLITSLDKFPKTDPF